MSTSTVPKPSTTIATALSVNVAAVMPVFLFGGLAVQVADELGMGAGSIGLVAGLYFALAGVTAVPAGRLVERYGAHACASIAVGLSAASMLATAALARDPVSLTALVALSAPANGLGQLSSNAVLSDWAPARRKGLLFGAKQSSIPLCTVLAGLSVPVIALTLGWRWAFVAGAALALLSLVPLAGIVGQPVPRRAAGAGRLDRRLVLFAFATCLGAVAATPLGSFLTTYAVHIGASEAFAGLNLTIGGITGIIARTAVGAIADRRGREFALIAVMLLGGAAGIGTFLVGEVWLLPLGTAAGFALGWAWPGLVNFGVAKRYPDAPAAATSITQTGVYLGGAIGPIAFGLVVEHAGWAAGWSVSVAAMTLAAGFVVAGWRFARLGRGRRRLPPRPRIGGHKIR